MRTVKCARVLAVASLLCIAVGCTTVFDNFRTVESGKFYRAAQMKGPVLVRTIKHHDIRTVVNLRGPNESEEWYRDELAACKEAGAEHYDLKWSKDRLPEPESLAKYVEICEKSKGPILVHCQAGIHRTGAASACYVLLEGGKPTDARKEFRIFFDDAYIGKVVDLYEGSPLSFAEWVRTEYPKVYATVPPSAPKE
jgi:protein tyrosine phosphatase (PTP) superfamily phosphohydrolase (DUF442 family)